jgi:Hypoxia induced protein conserved region
MGIGTIVILVLMLATAIALAVGIFLMARGGEANAKYGNKMMVLRVSLQGATLLLLAFLFMGSR